MSTHQDTLAVAAPDLEIRVIGPADARGGRPGATVVNTTSHSPEEWTRGLSPFYLGPINFEDGRSARRLENAWQFSKVYPSHVDAAGEPTAQWRAWSQAGFANDHAVRYPMGRGAKPLYLWLGGAHLDYIEARREVYFRLYRDAVVNGGAFDRLREVALRERRIYLWDFDGYDHDAKGIGLAAVINDPRRPMGHAFVLKAMLLYGQDVTPQLVETREAALGRHVPHPPADDLFADLTTPSNVVALRPR